MPNTSTYAYGYGNTSLDDNQVPYRTLIQYRNDDVNQTLDLRGDELDNFDQCLDTCANTYCGNPTGLDNAKTRLVATYFTE